MTASTVQTNTHTKKRWPIWPVGIASYYVFFVILCIIFAVMARGVRFDLVSDAYYEDAVNHDDHMRARARVRALAVQPSLEVDERNHRLIVRMPPEARGALLTLFRAADAREDRVYALQDIVPSVIDYGKLPHGRWQVQIRWENEGNPYYFQEDVFLP
jgi:hypothetical protein